MSKALFIVLSAFVSLNFVHCDEICLDDAEKQEVCKFPVETITKEDMNLLKVEFQEAFCRYGSVFRSVIVEKKSRVRAFEELYWDSLNCHDFLDNFSTQLYWMPGSKAVNYLNVFDGGKSSGIVIKRNIGKSGILSQIRADSAYKLKQYVRDNVDEVYMLIINQPDIYTLENVEKANERKRPVEIIDLGTFSIFNPTEDFQEINLHVNLTDNVFIKLENYYFFQESAIRLQEGDYNWTERGSYGSTLERTRTMKLTLSSPLPPRTSASGRIFATVTLTKTPFTANVRINYENSSTVIYGDFKKYEKINLRVENLKLSTSERQILFASYLACLVGLGVTLIIGISIFLICLVAQKKNKECICPTCPTVNLQLNLAKKRAFLADKGRKCGAVFCQVGRICGSLCNCIYKEIF
ncbi:uncharacterized protein LOC132266094 [Phlebotomus argentipes]|uniref:uncharacterized protein LOC132266094 n=1 Tax=Phlebotomus argentipes TaxID=94469 RepID=UPI0028937481|nr:uncharacterized protein LOC132266094 [Phlebotomus argentipes]